MLYKSHPPKTWQSAVSKLSAFVTSSNSGSGRYCGGMVSDLASVQQVCMSKLETPSLYFVGWDNLPSSPMRSGAHLRRIDKGYSR